MLGLIALATLIFVYALDRYQHRFVRSDHDLLRLLPDGDATVFYAQVDALRRTGLLSLVSDAKTMDSEYGTFVRATGFDYWKDVDAIAGSAKHDGLFLALKGRFNWDRIQSYVEAHQGSCGAYGCQMSATTPGNWISLKRMQSDVMGVAVGIGKQLASEVHPGQDAYAGVVPGYTVWINLAPGLLKDPSSLPAALRIFAISMQSANSALIALTRAREGSAYAFEIKLQAECSSEVIADTVRSQLRLDTDALKLELAREHRPPNPGDLTGLLTAGTFATNGKEVTGTWPVRKELLKTLQ